MAVIEKRETKSGDITYRVKIRLKGFPAQSATHRRFSDAKRWAQQTEAAIREGRHFKLAESKKRTLYELIERYVEDILPQKKSKKQSQLNQLRWWQSALGSYSLADITPAMITDQKNILAKGITYRGTLRSRSTVNRYLAVLSHAFTIGMKEWMWVNDNPMLQVSNFKEPRGRVRFLSNEERLKLLQACKEDSSPNIYPIVVLAISTGMRQGEILNLYWKDIDFENYRIVIHDTKNNERRSVPLVGLAHQVLQEHQDNQKITSLLVFPEVKPRRLQKVQKVQKPASVRGGWERVIDRSGIGNIRFHDLRHEFCSRMIMSGASLPEVMEVAGHKSPSMSRRYSHLSHSHSVLVVEKMNNKIFGSSE